MGGSEELGAGSSSQLGTGSSGHVARKRAERIRRIEGPSLYHYFGPKEEMFLACVEYSAAEVMQRLEAIARQAEPPGVRLRRMFAEQVLIEVRDFPAFVAVIRADEHTRHPSLDGLIPLTCNEIQRLFTMLAVQPVHDVAHWLA